MNISLKIELNECENKFNIKMKTTKNFVRL